MPGDATPWHAACGMLGCDSRCSNRAAAHKQIVPQQKSHNNTSLAQAAERASNVSEQY